jgi:serine/threonine protein kinase
MILVQVASALAFMHAHGLVHCDLKPDNIMIEEDDNHSMIVKLIDFGCVTVSNSYENSLPVKPAMTLLSIPQSGTKSYWSPEMLAGKDVKVVPNMDMWSLGCLLYIMISGRHPYDIRGNLSEEVVIDNILNAEVDLTSLPVWASISNEMKDIVRSLLDKNPNTRLSAPDLLERLSQKE